MPTLSTCAVAKKSFVGEKERLAATLDVRNASIRRPVGTSNVRIIESREVVTNQRESGENVWSLSAGQNGSAGNGGIAYDIKDTPTEPAQFPDDSSRLDINYT